MYFKKEIWDEYCKNKAPSETAITLRMLPKPIGAVIPIYLTNGKARAKKGRGLWVKIEKCEKLSIHFATGELLRVEDEKRPGYADLLVQKCGLNKTWQEWVNLAKTLNGYKKRYPQQLFAVWFRMM
jgi:hypothetical protein